jgi:hypothetical protein
MIGNIKDDITIIPGALILILLIILVVEMIYYNVRIAGQVIP